MEKLWRFVFEKLYCEKTGLIYENITEYTDDGNICNLPTPEQINLQVPNPCSWGTGMEDSMINAGIMLDTVIDRYEVTKDLTMKEYADKLLKGTLLCSTVSERSGFLARSVSPADCKSYYINTSRDQYTHVIYSLIRFMNCELCTKEQKEQIKSLVVGYANRTKEDATEQNGYQLMRADGRRGLVCKMWNVAPHEALRLPMFYLAGWICGGGNEFLELYRQYRDKGIETTLERQSACNTIILVQTQYSIRMLYDYDPDPEYREKYLKMLKFNAEHAAAYRIENIGVYTKENVNCLAQKWYDCPMRYEWGYIVTEGYDYPVPQDERRNFLEPIRNLASAITTVTLADMNVPSEQTAQFEHTIKLFDYDKHASEMPVRMVSAYWANKNNI